MSWRDRERAVYREEQFNSAMNAAQEQMTRIAADSENKQTKSRYASFAALDRALRPIYTKQGFSVSYDTGKDAPENHVRVIAIVSNGPYTRNYHLDIPIVTKGIRGVDMMTLTHATASASTYGKRYLLAMIFGIAIEQDDDGNSAGETPVEKINAEQAMALKAAIAECNETEPRFCRLWKIQSVPDLEASKFDDAMKVCADVKKRNADSSS